MRLRHSDIHAAGYRRRRCGRGFRYLDAKGGPLTDPAEVARLKELAVPPAWEDVWLCPYPNGHILAVGTDAAGRRQYLYNPEFRRLREQAKHGHVTQAAGVTVGRDGISFEYPGKSGRTQTTEVADDATRAVVRALLRRRDPSPRLLGYRAGNRWHEVDGSDVNDYLRRASGTDLTAKDFRTWHATVPAAVGLAASAPRSGDGAGPRRGAVTRTVREVADYLGNTPAVARASYINPRLVELYEDGVTIADALPDLGADSASGAPATRGPVERAVARLLKDGC